MVNSFNKVFLGAAGTSTGASDDQFNRVSFLSHFDGANNGDNNAFDDGSADNLTITTAGSVTQGSFGPFARPDGEWGVALDGTASFLRATGAGDISGNFTLEAWVFMNSVNGNYLHLTHNSGVINVVNIYNGSVQNFLFGTAAQPGQTTTEFNDTTWDAKVWTHLAIVRVSNTVKFYVNGVADATTVSLSGNLTDLEYIGTGRSFTSAGQVFDGKVSNVRFSSTARYTSNFTPSTTYFSSDSDTDLLTCQSNRFVDNSSNGHAITPSGSAAVTAFGPFLTSSVYSAGRNGASAFFDTSHTGVILVASPPTFATSSWTYEIWAYLTEPGTYKSLLAQGPRTQSGTDVSGFEVSSGLSLLFQIATSGANRIIMTGTNGDVKLHQWNHLAITHEYTNSSDSTYKTWVNGVLRQTLNHTGGFNWASGAGTNQPLVIGRNEFEGQIADSMYVADARLVVGSLVYTSNFTPPTAPLTAITNTKLLLNMADGQAIDSAAQNNLTLYGNANTSTDQVKFGNAALHLDGTGDFAKTELSTAFGTGDFTIECFYYNSASFANANKYLFDFGSNGLRVQFYEGTIYYFVDANNSVTTTADGVTHNNWYHLAAVRYNSQMNLYINGVSRATKNSVTTNLTERSLTIGDYGGGSQALQGFIDEFRISNFARYTSNFTAPAEPFADKGQ